MNYGVCNSARRAATWAVRWSPTWNGTLTAGPEDWHVLANGYGGGWKELEEAVDASGQTHLEVDLNVNEDNVLDKFNIILEDADGTKRVYLFDSLTVGDHQILTIDLDDYYQDSAIGHNPGLDLANIILFHIQGATNMAYPERLMDLTFNHIAFTDGYVPPIEGDLNGDGYIGLDDLDIVLNNWNAGTAPAGAANIPEPMSLTLLAAGGLGLISGRGKRL